MTRHIYDSKHQQRKEIRMTRKQLSHTQRAKAAAQLSKNIAQHAWFLNATNIALYIPSDGEIDPTGIIKQGRSMGKNFYLPSLKPIDEYFKQCKATCSLWFSEYPRKGEHFILNRFNIPEPMYTYSKRRIAVQALDIIFLPLVGFDENGNRLGMGGGFYDRTLGKLHNQHHPKRIGLAFELQKRPILETHAWDIPLHGIITEKKIYQTPVV